MMDYDPTDILRKYGERPGLFHISLNASQNPPAQQLTHRIKVMEKLIRDFSEGFSGQASRNLLGTFYFYNNQYLKAVETFQEVLKIDPNSLTASANLAFVYRRLKQPSKAEKYSTELASNDDERQGIALADQAFAFIFDCHVEKDVMERNKVPKDLLVQSLVKLQKSDRKDLVMEVNFWLGQTYYRLLTQCPRQKGTEEKAKEFYMKGVKALAKVTRFRKDDDFTKTYVSPAWAFLGLFLSRRGTIRDENGKSTEKTIEQMDDDIKHHLKELGLIQFLENPEDCFKKGLQCGIEANEEPFKESKLSTELLIRYAIFLKSKRRYKEALEKIDESLEIDKSQGNWFAWTVRADILFKLDRIDEAIKDKEIACSWNASTQDLCELAKAYQEKYKSYKTTDEKMADEFLLKASGCFLQAVESLRQQKRPEVHRAYGRFLREIGEVREAIECFKRAMEVDTANKATQSFIQLFETLLQFYQSSVLSDNKDESEINKLLHEMAYFYDVALRIHGQLINETKQFLKDFQVEMSVLTAYFQYYRNNSSFHINDKSLSEIITSAVEPENIDIWKEMVEKKIAQFETREKSKKSDGNAEGVTFCSKCKCQVGYKRQLSAFPVPPERPRNIRYPYDFYVIFSPLDRDWVCHVLLQTLEVSYGYKGAVAERDTIPGSMDIFKRTSFIQNCPKILVVLRTEFEDYPECNYELAHALHRMNDGKSENLVIPICRTINGMHPSLKTITYLDAVDDCDWNKLIKALELK
ncbi:tetratricopeptide repeat protein 22-like [Saccostrea echinata]|uniref:tetratricopeptide repeat protein 22-like n=1 Tax=Saccostrea echinata TaxID=191078 RepID=UPI002A7F8E7B|nr:tetratricopeptide repeat protein 22-like [Saccostrea echinata]